MELHAARTRHRIGPGDLTRAEARTEIQSILDRGTAQFGGLYTAAAEQWRRDNVKDDTLASLSAPFIPAVYPHPVGKAYDTAMEWLDDFSQRGTGQSARWRTSGGRS